MGILLHTLIVVMDCCHCWRRCADCENYFGPFSREQDIGATVDVRAAQREFGLKMEISFCVWKLHLIVVVQ